MENLDLTYGDKIKITWVHDDAKELYSVGDIKKIVGYSCCNRGDYLVDSNKKGHKISYIGNKDNQWSTYRVDYELYEKRSNKRKFKKGDVVYISSIPGYEDYLPEFFIVGSAGVIKRDDGGNKTYLVEFKEGRWWIDEDYLQIQKENNMKRFTNAQVGDLVHDEVFGDGEICSINLSEVYPLDVSFKSSYYDSFTLDGEMLIFAIKPTLFYREGEEKYLTERPKPEIDWSKVPAGTKVLLDGKSYGVFMAYLPQLETPFWVFDGDTFDVALGHHVCNLAEPCRPEWIKK